MDAATGLQPIVNHLTVSDRRPQKRGNRRAFERALAQEGEGDREEDRSVPETPMGSRLQPQQADCRRQDGHRHVDVLA